MLNYTNKFIKKKKKKKKTEEPRLTPNFYELAMHNEI